jgi:hypothetical protein
MAITSTRRGEPADRTKQCLFRWRWGRVDRRSSEAGICQVGSSIDIGRRSARIFEALRRLEIPDEMQQKKYGLAPLGAGPVKNAIFGLNAARLYNVPLTANKPVVDLERAEITADKIQQMRAEYRRPGAPAPTSPTATSPRPPRDRRDRGPDSIPAPPPAVRAAAARAAAARQRGRDPDRSCR